MCIYRWLITVVGGGGGVREDGHRVLYFSSTLGFTTSGSRLEVSGYILLRYLAAIMTGRTRKGCWDLKAPLGNLLFRVYI